MDATTLEQQSYFADVTVSKSVSERIFYLDNLRAIALLLGIFLHSGLSYCALTQELWPSADTTTSWLFDYWIWFIHTFRMPLFFLIAGFFAHYLVQKRGVKGFIKNRLLRIALPFVIFWPIVIASILGILLYAAANMPVDNTIIRLFQAGMENPEAAKEYDQPLSTSHLWFLYYLTLFCLGTALIYRFGKGGSKLFVGMAKPWVSLILLPLVTILILSNTGMPHPAPERFKPELWALAFFGLFFTMGWAFYTNREWLEKISAYWPYLIASSLIATVVLLLNLPEPIKLVLDPDLMKKAFEVKFTTDHFLRVIATSVLAWHMTILCLIGTKRFLNKSNALLRYISDGSYWAYIVHLPLVAYLQLVFNPIHMPIVLEFFIIVAVTLAGSYLSYAVLVRPTPIGWLLNGRKKVAG